MSTMVNDQPATELISVADAARRFGVTTATVYGWLARGEIMRYPRPLGYPRTFVDALEIERKLRPALEGGRDDA